MTEASPTRSLVKSSPEVRALRGLNSVDAALWLVARVASGLGHAHERGIVHRDLKPANILLADDGRPMLLDFNLSEDTKREAADALIGGTLPYMAPEQIVAFQQRTPTVDPRSDVYALGVVLFELLAGRAPFPIPSGDLEQRVACSLQDRLNLSPASELTGPGITRAIRAIVQRALARRAEDRYQSAEELREDLQRQLDQRPLRHAPDRSIVERSRKWARRHPRVTSASGVALVALSALLLIGGMLIARQRRLDHWQALEALRQAQSELASARIDSLQSAVDGRPTLQDVLSKCQAALDRVSAATGADGEANSVRGGLSVEQTDELHETVREMRQLMAALAEAHSRRAPPESRAVLEQQALDLIPQALAVTPETPPVSFESPRALGMEAFRLSLAGHFHEALPPWRQATRTDPRQAWAWHGLAICQAELGDWEGAIASLTACIVLAPDLADAYARRGVAHLRWRDFAQAKIDFQRALELAPSRHDVRVNHALTLLEQGQANQAAEELTAAIARDPGHARLYAVRAQARRRMGDADGAADDERLTLACTPRDEHDWIAHGLLRLADDPAAARDAFASAVESNPACLPARENLAHVLSERLGQLENAIAVLDDASRVFPDKESVFAARGVLLARLGRRKDAIRDARRALELRDAPDIRYYAAGVYAQTAKQQPLDKLAALSLLASALREGFGEDVWERDADLDPLRGDATFQSLAAAVRLLQSTAEAPASDPAITAQSTAARSE